MSLSIYPKKNISKFESKTIQCIFLGYDDQIKAYRIFFPLYYKICVSLDIVLDEILIKFDHVICHSLPRDELELFLEVNILSKKSSHSVN